MAQPVVFLEVGATDMGKAHESYTKLFDWTIETPPGMDYGLVAVAGDGSIGGGIGPLQEGMKPYVT